MKNYLKNSVIYQVFPRNFSKEGDFKGVSKKLEYIKDLGADIIQLTPICPIGEKNRKGSLGSPYSIKDYNEINPEYGNWNDFKKLLNKAHSLGLKVIIDIVYNHTSKDSKLLNEHPEWFYKNKDGEFANKLGNWSDVTDLDYSKKGLIDYLLNSLEKYLAFGVDGFRFDVASLISKQLYFRIKNELLTKYPNTIMIAESVHANFTLAARKLGFNALSDSELFENGFDALYEYNSREYFDNYLKDLDSFYFEKFKVTLHNEESNNPTGNMRIRGYENHDTRRINELTSNKVLRRNILAYDTILKGPLFVCMGLETKQDHHIDLFDKDLMNWHYDQDWFTLVKKLIQIKKDERNTHLLASEVSENKGTYLLYKNYYDDSSYSYGLFNFSKKEQTITDENLLDGEYIDLISNNIVIIKNHTITIKEPLILNIK